MQTRRQFQIGRSTYRVEQASNGFYIEENWWQMRSDGQQEDMVERVAGPFPNRDVAAHKAAAMQERAV